jgi:CHAT domain-containing protein
MQLPFGAPDVVVLPGYQTLAENGLRGRPNGDEVMVATCGLMAAGSRTLVIARWRTGGQMSMEVVREFLQVLPQESAASAWQRAILLARSAELDPASEPRLKDVKPGEVPTAAHPFFWAGYLMMGTR